MAGSAQSLKCNEDYPKGRVVTLSLLAKTFRIQCDYDNAIVVSKRQRDLCRDLGDLSGEGIALENIGTAYMELGEWEKALAVFGESLEIRKSKNIRDIPGLGITFDLIAQLHARRGKWAQAHKVRLRMAINLLCRTLPNHKKAMNNKNQSPDANCPKCKKTKLIDHNGGKWCALCGEFAGDFVQVACTKSDAERTARFLSAHEDNGPQPNSLRCSSCFQPVDIGDAAYDDGEWTCGECIAGYA